LAQDDYYYEIQLTNKQLIFYFMAGAAGLILSFLAGVMVGRGVEGGNVAAAESTRVVEERVVPEATPSAAPADYSYPQRLESERAPEGLERPAVAATAPPPSAARPTSRATPAAAPTPTPAPVRATPAALPTPPARSSGAPSSGLPRALGPNAKGFVVQVGAFKDRAGAEAIVKSLKSRGLPAFTVVPAAGTGGLYAVRVGAYRDRADAEAVVARLRDEKFQPYVTRQ
jgi:rare lipoprotein A